MNNIDLGYEEIHPFLQNHRVVGNKKFKFNNIKSLSNANNDSLVFIDIGKENINKLILSTVANVILVPNKEYKNINNIDKTLIFVDNPKITFSKIANKYLVKEILSTGIHPTAVIHPDAVVSKNAIIGPFCVLGKCQIGENSILFGNNYVFDSVKIGDGVKIDPGTVIGAEGFGYNKEKNGALIQFPHIGGVIIEDGVEIGSNTSIDRGALSDTVIKRGAKIDNLVNIAHNAVIGENTLIGPSVMVAGSTIIGDNCYVAPSVALKDQLSIGNDSFIGLGATVLKDIPDSEIWAGSPARKFEIPLHYVGVKWGKILKENDK